MIATHPDCPPGVTLLADHLDAALAAGEDLLACRLDARADLDERDAAAAPEAMDRFLARVMQLEASLLLRVLQARRLSSEINRTDGTLKSIGGLFRAQSDVLQVLIDSRARGSEAIAVARAGDGHAYLRSRGLLAPEAAAPSPYEAVMVSEAFRVGGVAPLGGLLDLVSGFLDFIDARYGLYPSEPTRDMPVVSRGLAMLGEAAAYAGRSPMLGEVARQSDTEALVQMGEPRPDEAMPSAPRVDVVSAADGGVAPDADASNGLRDDATQSPEPADEAHASGPDVADDAFGGSRLAADAVEGDIAPGPVAGTAVDAPERLENSEHDALRRSLKAMLAEVHRPA